MKELLTDLLETLDQLLAQAEAYEQALPADNYPARAAVNTLSEIAQQARNQAGDLEQGGQIGEGDAGDHPFSPRELEILKLVAKGLTNKEIAYRLHLSDRTVQYHLRSVFNKSGTDSRTEAVVLALQQGWLT